mmetsp:Transcript_31223/g.44872  ORF Transcript_31223/g.44872 Transcript_31223/m.44872 type:complete len:199 (+) Transcript_31223:69-665(+)
MTTKTKDQMSMFDLYGSSVLRFFEPLLLVHDAKKDERLNRRRKKRLNLIRECMIKLDTAGSIFTGISAFGYYCRYTSSEIPHLGGMGLCWHIFLLTLTIISYLLWSLARYQLGRSLALQPTSCGPLITHGLYRRIRHPIYLFSGLFLLFFPLLTRCYSLLLLLPVLVPVQAMRALMENHALKTKFGEEYDMYCRQVWL